MRWWKLEVKAGLQMDLQPSSTCRNPEKGLEIGSCVKEAYVYTR